MFSSLPLLLTHRGRATHICVGKPTIIGADIGLSPDRRQAIIWTNAGLLLIGPLGTNFSEILIEILTFSFKKMRLKVSSAKRRLFCLGLNVLRQNWKWNYPRSWEHPDQRQLGTISKCKHRTDIWLTVTWGSLNCQTVYFKLLHCGSRRAEPRNHQRTSLNLKFYSSSPPFSHSPTACCVDNTHG